MVMEKTIRFVSDLNELKAQDYRYWQSVPAAERMKAVWELSVLGYQMKGFRPDGQELRRSVVRLELPRR
jgi:hypothetical protein